MSDDDDRTEPVSPSAAPREAGDDAERESDAPAAPPSSESRPDAPREGTAPAGAAAPWHPSYGFLGVVSTVTLVLDLGTKIWAKARLDDPKALIPKRIEVISDHLSMVFARNKGGAFGLLQDEHEAVRRPFFLLISVLAVAFIVSLYRKLTPTQTALKWGLPLVLGGAVGNFVDRIRYGYVIDFIDYRADWVRFVFSITAGERASDHWPTFNVADVAICVGVGLMAIDMFTTRKKPEQKARASTARPAAAAAGEGEGDDDAEEPRAKKEDEPEAPSKRPKGEDASDDKRESAPPSGAA